MTDAKATVLAVGDTILGEPEPAAGLTESFSLDGEVIAGVAW